MAEKWKEQATIVRQDEIAIDIYSIWFQTKQIAQMAKPGQFINIYSKEGSRLLPRPISICEINKKKGQVRVIYRVAGKGTEEFSHYHTGTVLDIIGPLGNGYTLKEKKAFLVGGGIGIPPLLELAKQLKCEKQIVVGFRGETFLTEELAKYGELSIATEDGRAGIKGTVLDAIKEKHLTADIIYACGPTPMLRAIKEYAMEHGIEAQISLEEKMACGIGACLACVCQSKDIDAHSNVKNKRVCKDGPVFDAQEVEL